MQLVKKILNNFIKIVNFVIPRSNKIVVVGGWQGKRFADNSKAMYLHLCDNKERYNLDRVVFVSRNKSIINDIIADGKNAYNYNSLLGIYYQLRAGYHFVDQCGVDVNRFTSIGAKKINLWHGFPLKRIGMYSNNIEIDSVLIGEWNKSFYVATSIEDKKHLMKAFGRNDDKVLIGMSPRIDYLLNCSHKFFLKDEINIYNYIKMIKKSKKIIGYFPTFRDCQGQNQECIDTINKLQSWLVDNDIYLITKLHLASKNKEVINANNVIILPDESDLYNFLDETDVLITDYSSVYFDYILLNKPIIFYCFDLEYYENKDRGFLYDYNEFTPGKKVKEIEELKNEVLTIFRDYKNYMERYEEKTKKIINIVYDKNTFDDGIYGLWKSIENVS